MPHVFPAAVAPRVQAPRPQVGDYFSTERDLYRVEELHGEFALIEDCRAEIVLEVAIEEILAMNPVRLTSESASA